MKKIILTLVILGMFTGCSTINPAQTARIQSATYVAAYVGTSETLQFHPEWRAEFQLAVDNLKLLEAGPIDILRLMEIVKRLPVKELKSDRANLYITAGTILLVDQIGNTPIDKLNDLKPFITSIRSGIERGLE